MSRVINMNNPGKLRSRNMRTIAELLRHVSARTELDAEALDLLAAIVFALREIHASALVTIEAWEKRGYWMKADRFMRDWEWSGEMAANFEDVIRNGAWDLIPRLMGELAPHTAEVQIKNMTRSPSTWQGAYKKLLSEAPRDLPY